MPDTEDARAALAATAIELFPQDVATILEPHDPEDTARLLEKQSPHAAANVLAGMRSDIAADIAANLSDQTFRAVMPHLDPTQSARWLARWDEQTRVTRLEMLDRKLAHELRTMLTYAPDTAGALMDPRFTVAGVRSTVEDALTSLQQRRSKRIYQLLVVDRDGKLAGAVPIADLALSAPEISVGDLMRPVTSISDTASHTDVVETLEHQNLPSLPVVDFNGHLIGVIRHDALVRAAATEATVDIQTMVGASKDERALSSVTFAVRKRLPWLHVNLLTAFLAAAVVGIFEGTIARFTALAILMPVAAGQSGNTGAQALAVTMRGLALREIRISHWFRVMAKEFGVGALNGFAVAAVTAASVFLWSDSLGLAIVIGVAMLSSMTIASAAGALVPIGLTVLKQDPAQASSIILTTITDIVGFVSFLGLATLLSGLL